MRAESDMNLELLDGQCVRITTVSGEVYEGIASYHSEEYVFHEYGRHQEALYLTPILLYKDDILDIVSLEEVNGPFGHYSEPYGLLEKKCLEWGTDLMEEVFESEDYEQICRMMKCMNDQFQSLADRAVPGMAPWRSGKDIPKSEDAEDETGPVYLGELENMLGTLAGQSSNEEAAGEAKLLLRRLSEYFA